MTDIAFVDFETQPIVVGGPPPVPVGVAIWQPGREPTYLAFAHATGNNATLEDARQARLKDASSNAVRSLCTTAHSISPSPITTSGCFLRDSTTRF